MGSILLSFSLTFVTCQLLECPLWLLWHISSLNVHWFSVQICVLIYCAHIRVTGSQLPCPINVTGSLCDIAWRRELVLWLIDRTLIGGGIWCFDWLIGRWLEEGANASMTASRGVADMINDQPYTYIMSNTPVGATRVCLGLRHHL